MTTKNLSHDAVIRRYQCDAGFHAFVRQFGEIVRHAATLGYNREDVRQALLIIDEEAAYLATAPSLGSIDFEKKPEGP